MTENFVDEYAMQTASQKEIIRTQGDEAIKPHLPTIHQQMQETQAVILDQINPKRVVAEILLELDGKEMDQYGNIKKIGKSYVNEEGLRNIKIRMRSVINQGSVMSFLNDKEVKAIMLRLANDLATDLALNWREYGIENRTICDTIMNIVLIGSYLALKRSEEQNEKRFLKGITLESIGGGSQTARKRKEGGWEEFKNKIKL